MSQLTMDSYKLAIKLFFQDSSHVHVEDFVPVFHRWIQTRALEDHQLIDVADYKHVHQGPGLVLISHQANIHIDLEDARPGLLYIRKQPLAGSFRDRLKAVLRSTLQCASMLQADESMKNPVRFRTAEMILRFHDRLHAPNTPEIFSKVRANIDDVLRNLYPDAVQLAHQPHPEKLFEVRTTSSQSPTVEDLLERIAMV